MGDENGAPLEGQVELVEALAQFVGEDLLQFVPDLGDDRIADLALRIAQEQIFQIDAEILPTLEGAHARTHPTLVCGLFHVDDPEHGAQVKCAKALAKGMDVGIALQTAAVLSLLASPHIRARLRVCGFVYTFAQSAEPTQGSTAKPRIIM